jgi:AraC-like DNA-binding protein
MSSMSEEERPADSTFATRIRRVRYETATQELAAPDGSWDMIFIWRHDELLVLQTGQIATPVVADWGPGDSVLSIAFRPEVYMPQLPGRMTAHQGVVRPLAGRQSFWVGNDRLEVPSFDNAEQFIRQLASRGLIERDRVVRRALDSELQQLDDRTTQRHFADVTGLSAKTFQQVLRASDAVRRLEVGETPASWIEAARIEAARKLLESGIDAPKLVAAKCGFADANVLRRAFVRQLGVTPAEYRRRHVVKSLR